MKKKLFTLLALLIALCSGAKADVVLCTAQVPTGQTGTFNNTDGITSGQTGCTLKWSGLQGDNNIVTINSVDFYKMGSNDAYVQLVLSSGSFRAGDILTATVTSNGGNSAKTVNIKIKETATTSVSVKSSETKDITYTLTSSDIEADGSIKIYRNTNGSNLRVAVFSVSGTRSGTAYTVTFDAGSNGTCATSSLTEASASAGIELPSVTPKSGFAFTGWYTAATEGSKVGNAGEAYYPTANITLYAQYVEEIAPGISIDSYNPSTIRGKAITLTATITGSPVPTVKWYSCEDAEKKNPTAIYGATNTTYSPSTDTEGTFYYYAVASNGVNPDATSDIITLTVTSPDKDIVGNAYYVATDEGAVNGEKVYCDDITMEYISSGAFNKAVEDEMIKSLNSNYVASIASSTNGWGAEFTPSTTGILAVGLVANKDKTFSITNVSSFSYKDNGNHEGTINSNSWDITEKFYGIITINVVAGTTYKFSVAGSKMGLYGFEFTPTAVAITPANAKSTYVTTKALDFSEVEGLKAYVATEATADGVTINPVGAVPAETPLILIGTAGTNYSVPVVASATAPTTNLLMAGDGTTEFNGTTYDYILYSDGKFYQIGSGTVAVGKAYLHLDGAPAARSLQLLVNEEITGISSMNSEGITDNRVFDLQGRTVKLPTKGLYIVNGKKVIIK